MSADEWAISFMVQNVQNKVNILVETLSKMAIFQPDLNMQKYANLHTKFEQLTITIGQFPHTDEPIIKILVNWYLSGNYHITTKIRDRTLNCSLINDLTCEIDNMKCLAHAGLAAAEILKRIKKILGENDGR